MFRIKKWQTFQVFTKAVDMDSEVLEPGTWHKKPGETVEDITLDILIALNENKLTGGMIRARDIRINWLDF